MKEVNILRLLIVMLGSAFFQSCQKDFVDPMAPGITPADSVMRLSRLLYFDANVSATDTTLTEQYIYDSRRRVTAINTQDYRTGKILYRIVYYYHGSDSLAYKKTETDADTDPAYPYTDTTFFFYDSQRRLIKDSLVFPLGREVFGYIYAGTMITALGKLIYNNDPSKVLTEVDTAFITSSGDVFKTALHTFNDEYYVNTFTYDNKINPFYQLNIHTTYNPVPHLDEFSIQKNNTLVVTNAEPLFPGSLYSNTYTYTYNRMELPASLQGANSFGQPLDYKVLFLYKKI